MFRQRSGALEFLLVHPGGPFFARKDLGVWTIPKGEAMPEENLLERAKIEFAEELGVEAAGKFFWLGSIKQKGGKTVHSWAFAGDFAGPPRSNTFEMEWPPRSGRRQIFPEIDRAEFFPLDVACEKINPAQRPFLDRVVEHLA